MIPINIDPNIASIGPFLLSWHGLFTGLGMVAGVWLALVLAARFGLPEDDIYAVALWSIFGGIVGARLFHVVDALDYYVQNPVRIFMITEGGIAVYGAIVGGIITGVVVARLKRLPVGTVVDIASPALILGQAIGRLGDVINGEHHAIASDLPFSVAYVHPNTLGDPGLAVHLAVGYELVWDVLVFGLLLVLLGNLPRPGMVLWTYIGSYSLGRFFISFLRLDTVVALGLRQAQIVAVVGIVAAAIALVWLATRRVSKPQPEPVPADRRRRPRVTR
ncbi:MAG: prolipoprotein diacylglyceryl transferase [Chloroflexi bacterium]|nr:prolipoprotein diacylglyceryl transferase [Chloroflexota bacterium]